MQFSVPQFTEVEDKIIGPLTLKQFFILLGGAVVIFILHDVTSSFIIFLMEAIPIGALALILAFAQFNGKSMIALLVSALNFVSEPRAFIFHRHAEFLPRVKQAPPEQKAPSTVPVEEKMSRLHKLTYILDQDVKAEEELIKEKFGK